ncbi:uncharacterized protein [Parasteatoda tepidariorum]|uniref:uncharacterized protein n=1 Tax=Parasteatoda tepidariorum TaxID=114398 RepID=UPI0039BD1FB4
MITENSVAPFAPPDENMYVSCEFCGKDILMDQEAIIVHESGCRPDLLSLPSVVSNEHKLRNSAHEAYSYNDKASALQRKRRSLEKPEDKKESAKEECGICSLIVPKDKLSEHFSKCVVENSNNPYSECGMSTPQPIASCADGSKIKMHTEGAKINLYPSMGELLLCPYCSMNFLSKRFANHKKYCKSALVECPICQDTYHIDEKEEHRTTCDALDTVLIPESDLKLELQKKFGTLHFEENLRDFHETTLKCNSCKRYIPIGAMDSHLTLCTSKKSPYCDKFVKSNLQTHLTKCNDCKKLQQESLNNRNTGAKPKNKNSEETSAFYRITGAFKSLFSDFEKANPSHSVDSQTNMYPADANYNVELRNKFGTLHSDENKREKEALYEQCPFCESKIHQHSYSKHLLTCSLSMKQCHLCKQEFPKESERDHFTVCPKLIKISSKSGQDEFFYGGFSKSDSKTKFAIDEDNQEAIEKALLQENEAFTFGSSNKEKNVEEEKLSFKYSPNPFLNNKDSKYHIQNDLTESDNEENESLEEFWERADIKLAQRLRQFTKIKTD